MITTLRVPVIAAPMAGGVSTPELVTAVGKAGGLGFLAAGYLTVDALAGQLAETRRRGGAPFGVNLFVPGPNPAVDLSGYTARLQPEAARYRAELGRPEWDDDAFAAKLDLVVAERIPVVSFTFGLPGTEAVRRLHEAGSEVVVTVTTPAEALLAVEAGADALCVQGTDAGGHRGVFIDDPSQPGGGPLLGLLAALRLVASTVDVPLIATGGLVHGADVAAVLVAGAAAAQLGTAFLRCPEAGTPAPHREALADADRPTELTRAFTGRPARGLVNRFLAEHTPAAPSAYPQLHRLTRPLRAASAAAGDPEAMSLWTGQTYALATALPAAELVGQLREQARDALSRACGRYLD